MQICKIASFYGILTTMKVSGLPKNKIYKEKLLNLYIIRKKSVANISERLKCSENKINYWLAKYGIEKRSISEAIYHLKNPLGDPFLLKQPENLQEGILFGLGLGLYWGEGSKRGKGGVRLGNTDVRLIKKFIEFLKKFLGVKKSKLRFGLQIFGDVSSDKALLYWKKELKIKKNQFYKIIVSKIRGAGTYKYKSEHGVLMVYFNNTRLKELICKTIDNI